MQPLLFESFLLFHKQYSGDYKIAISPKVIVDELINSRLVKYQDNFVSISYKYVYYFFVAKYLANNISDDVIKDKIKSLCQRVHRDEFGSIVMFLTHLSKDQFVLTQLLESSKSLFKDNTPLRFEKDISFINEMVNQLPISVYKAIDVKTVKEEELKAEEELDLHEKEFEKETHFNSYDLNEDISALDVISTIIKAMKTIEIVGQVTKKYWGELKANQKYSLAEETYMLGLRSLGFLYSHLQNQELLVEYLTHVYRRRNPERGLSKSEVEKVSRDYLFGLAASAGYAVIRRITNAIGYDKLDGTFKDILHTHNYNSVRMIDASINLDHHKSFPWHTVKKLKKDNRDNYLVNIILRRLVINYLYVFITSDTEKDKICQLLGIQMEQQIMIDSTSKVKRES